MKAKACSHCGLSNPESAQRCDCGYDFATGAVRESYLRPEQQARLRVPAPRTLRGERTGTHWLAKGFYWAAAYPWWTAWQTHSLSAEILGACIVESGVLLGVAAALDSGFKRNAQRKRDADASRVMEAIRSANGHPQFFLYLRPFIVTNRMAEPASGNPFDLVPQQDLEEKLADALIDHGHLVSLGDRFEAIGASRFPVSEDGWKDKVLEYLKKATLVFIIPGYQDGTRWEMEQILAQGYLDKTVFVTPVGDSSAFDAKAHWEQTANDWQEKLNLHLPKYGVHDCFQLDKDSKVRNLLPLHKLASRKEMETLMRGATLVAARQ